MHQKACRKPSLTDTAGQYCWKDLCVELELSWETASSTTEMLAFVEGAGGELVDVVAVVVDGVGAGADRRRRRCRRRRVRRVHLAA